MLSWTFSSWGWLLGLGRAGPAVEEDRRSWGRIPCDVETTCQVVSAAEQAPLPVRVRNISRGGGKLLLAQAFPPGELLSVSLPGGEDQEVRSVLACVVRCVGDGRHWQLGCTFATPLDDEELERFGVGHPGSAPSDQRAKERFACQAAASYTVVGGAGEQAARPAAVVNISANGIALLTPAPLNVGHLLSVELRRGEGPTVLTTLASVVRTTVERGGDRIAGCNFIHELSEAQIQLLL